MVKNHLSYKILSLTILSSMMLSNKSNARVYLQGQISYEANKVTIDDIGKVGLVIGAVGLATYGMAKFGSWLFNKSDGTIVEQAQQAMREASAQYMNLTTILADVYSDSTDRQDCISRISETILYAIAKTKYHDADIETYIYRFLGTIKNLDKHAKKLRDRIQALQYESDQDYQTLRIISRMKAIENQIQTMLPGLSFAYDYLKHHQTYFTLFETEDNMMYRYERDLHAVDSYQGDLSYFREMLHQSVMLYQRRHSDPYPYRWYLRRLEDDIHYMHAAMNKLSYEYSNRYNVALALCNKLELIRETLIGSPYYSDELRAYEYAKIAQAAIDAQQRQARAQEQQAHELQRHNNLQAQSLGETYQASA